MIDPREEALAFFDAYLWQTMGYASFINAPEQMRFVTNKEKQEADSENVAAMGKRYGIGRGTKITSGILMAATRESAILIASENYIPENGVARWASIYCTASKKERWRLLAQWLRDTQPGEAVLLETTDKKPDSFLRLSYPRQAVIVKPNEPLVFDWLAFQDAAIKMESSELSWKDCKTVQALRDKQDVKALRKRLHASPDERIALSLPHHASGTGQLLATLF